jgi:hypothetical protein
MNKYIIYDGMKWRFNQGYYISSNLKNYKNDKNNKRTISLHRYIWEKYNGPIPCGMYVHHKDKNTENNNIENLELISSIEHTRLHNKGLRRSTLTREKQSISAILRWKNKPYKPNKRSEKTKQKMRDAWKLRKLSTS